MKLYKLPGYMLGAIFALSVACNPDKAAENANTGGDVAVPPVEQNTSRSDSLSRANSDSILPVDSVTAEIPAVKAPVGSPPAPAKEQPRMPAKPQPKPKPQPIPKPQPELPKEPIPKAEGFQEGTYQLVQVQGENLPLVLDMTTECDTKLLNGVMVIKDGKFRFESNTAEVCSGKISNQEKHEASGDYRLEDSNLFLTIRYGDAFGDARGVVAGNTIRLQHIGNNEEQQAVDWLLRRK